MVHVFQSLLEKPVLWNFCLPHPHLHPLRSALVVPPKVSPLRPLRLRQNGAVALLPLLEVGEVVPAQCAVQFRLSQGN